MADPFPSLPASVTAAMQWLPRTLGELELWHFVAESDEQADYLLRLAGRLALLQGTLSRGYCVPAGLRAEHREALADAAALLVFHDGERESNGRTWLTIAAEDFIAAANDPAGTEPDLEPCPA